MSPAALFRILVVFLIAAVYVLIGAFHWSEPLTAGSGHFLLQLLASLLVYGNLMVLLSEAIALSLLPWRRKVGLRVWLPLVLVSLLVLTGELAVRSNLRLPPLIGATDPMRLVLVTKAVAQAAALTVVLLALPALLWRLGALRWLEDRKRPGRMLFAAQALITIIWVVSTGMALSSAKPELKPNASLQPLPDRGLALVCVDAAYWKIIDEMIAAGHLPNIAKLRENGTWGHLITHGKRLSPIVWTTLVTGVTAEKHGVLGWTEPTKDGRTIMVPSTSRNAAALWNIADASGLSSLVLNWLITAPPEEINGAVIPNLDHMFNGVSPVTHPPALAELVQQEFDAAGYRTDNAEAELLERVDLVERVYKEVTKLRDYDLVITGTQATDDVQHRYLLYRYPELYDPAIWDRSPEKVTQFHNTITAVYERVDQMLGTLMADGRPIVIVSDHGARPRTEAFAVFNMNALLEDLGVAKCLPHGTTGERSGNADMQASVAFAAGNDAWHNDLAFFVQDPPTAEMAPVDVDKLFADLRSLKLEESGHPLFDEIVDLRDPKNAKKYKRHAKRGAIGVAVMSNVLRQSPRGRSVRIAGKIQPMDAYVHVRQNINGSHAPRGIFLFSGGAFPVRGAIDKLCLDTSFSELLRYMIGTQAVVDKAVAVARAFGIMDPYSTLDIMPTLLSYLGLPIGQDMDGRIMGAVLRGIEHSTVARTSYDDLLQSRQVGGNGPSDEDNERMMQQLRALGYVN